MLRILSILGIDTAGYNGAKLDFSLPHIVWLLLLSVVCGAVIYLSIKGASQLDVRRRRWFIAALRALAVLLAAGIVTNPALVMEKREPVKPRMALLWDISASMGLKAASSSESRLDEMKEFWSSANVLKKKLAENYMVEIWGFGTDASPMADSTFESGPQSAPVADATDILNALNKAVKEGSSVPLAGAILFSDGADNVSLAGLEKKPDGLKRVLKNYPAPVYPVVGGAGEMKDISIVEVQAPDYAFIRNAVDIKVKVEVRGYTGMDVPVTLSEGERVITTKMFSLTPQTSSYEITLSLTPDRVGTFIYTVKAAELEGEAVSENNTRRFSIEVLRDKIRVLHVVGSPSWDQRFLREALTNDPTIELISFYILREIDDAPMADTDELSLIPFPVDELFNTKIRTFDLIIFQNFSWRVYLNSLYIQNIKSFVTDYGGGFLMIGGPRGFSGGGYAGTPIADILPVEVTATEKPFEGGEYKARLTDAGARHPITALRPGVEASKSFWDSLPPLDGFNYTAGPKPGAAVLLEHPFASIGGANLPLMAIWQTGRGRAMAVMTASLWRLNFLNTQAGGSSADYVRLWRSAVRWLVGDPEGKQVRVRTDKIRYGVNEIVKVRVKVLGKDYAPAKEPFISLVITGEGGSRQISGLKLEGEEWVLDMENPGIGGWKLEASARDKSGESLGSDETAFIVEGRGAELDNPFPNPELLEQIAQITGGKTISLGSGGDFGSLPSRKAWRVTGRKTTPLWDNWIAGTLILLIFSLEWYFRRRWGLN